MTTITDEMVEAGLKGLCMYYDDGTCAKSCYACRQDVCNAIAAVAPRIRAAALEEAAQELERLAIHHGAAAMRSLAKERGDE